jgi:hypothetical protein
LKRLGAVLLNDAVWVLPATPRTAEQFQWLAAEIQEMQGNVNLWQANLVLGLAEDTLMEQFTRQVDQEYMELLKKLDKKNPDPASLSQQFQQILGKDYFQSELGLEVKSRLLALQGLSK